jgi:HD-like signal output (HDOD) protein
MHRILFVDDEPRILEGLQRLLRPHRDEWKMSFALGGKAALEALAAEPFDVIVSDMRMPNMDGATLLAAVREAYPDIVRIVLSGHTEVGLEIRAVQVAQQFITKPCTPETLRGVISRACNLQSLLVDATIRAVVGTMEALPSLPRLYSALTQAVSDPDVSLHDIGDIVGQDVAMCAKVLQLVNSAFFALPRRVTSIHSAVSLLGTNMLRSLVLSAEVFRSFDGPGYSPSLHERLQEHALLTGGIARRLLTDRRQAEDAMMAGILHDVGILILATRMPEHHAEALARSRATGLPLTETERQIMGVTHAEIGAYLLGLWGLPFVIVEAVAYHHQPMRVGAPSLDVLAAVHIAEALAIEAAGPTPRAGAEEYLPLEPAYVEALGVSERLVEWRSLAAAQALGGEQDGESRSPGTAARLPAAAHDVKGGRR